jgi:hypothetical protein
MPIANSPARSRSMNAEMGKESAPTGTAASSNAG